MLYYTEYMKTVNVIFEMILKIKKNLNLINKIMALCASVIIALCISACGSVQYVEDNINRGDIVENSSNEENKAITSFAESDTESAIGDSSDNAIDDSYITNSSENEESEAGDSKQTKLQFYRSQYETDEISLEELDGYRAELRADAAKPFEASILEEYLDEYEYNDRTIGYIHIDDTVIDAPVLQTLEDYEYYLHRDIDGNLSEPGCIILDADSEIGIGTRASGYLNEYEPTPIQLVHGHNMRNGTMFGSLLKYADENYGNKHNIIYYDSIYEKREYELVCAFYSQIYSEDDSVFKYYDIEGIDTFDKAYEWFENVSELALYKTDNQVLAGDELIVLSTCSYQVEDGRFAVVAKRIK